MYKFCGLPTGVSILPKFAEIVSSITIFPMLLLSFTDLRKNIVNGTKVISATSFVINILEKKQSITIKNVIFLLVSAFLLSTFPKAVKTFILLKPHTVIIRQNNKLNVLKSI